MDRFEADVVSNANGDVVVHVGAVGVRAHVVVDVAAGYGGKYPTFGDALDALYGSCKDVDWERPEQWPDREIEAL